MTPEQVKALRLSLGLTQAEFADRLGVIVTTVSRWERARYRPSKLACRTVSRLRAMMEMEFTAGRRARRRRMLAIEGGEG